MARSSLSGVAISLAIALLASCSDSSARPESKPQPQLDADAEAEADAGAEADAQPACPSSVQVSSTCSEGGSVLPFDPTATGTDFGQRAGDFTLTTLDGTLHLSDIWNGCDSIVFIDMSSGLAFELLNEVTEWLQTSPANVHYILYPPQKTPSSAESYRTTIETAPGYDETAWKSRIHYVSELDASGWVDQRIVKAASIGKEAGFAIDRQGTIRTLGGNGDLFGTAARLLTYVPKYYNFEAAREVTLASEEASVLPILDHVATANPNWVKMYTVSAYQEVELPSAAELAAYGTVELDHEVTCASYPEHQTNGTGGCAEWDSQVDLYLCDPGISPIPQPTAQCDTLVARLITPYARPGRWITDVSHLLALAKEGGKRTFRLYSQQPVTSTMSLRFIKKACADKRVVLDIVPLTAWNGLNQKMDPTYNDRHTPIVFDAPVGTTAAELFLIVTGHHEAPGSECGEWCNHQHLFTLNVGTTHKKDHPGIRDTYGCADTPGSVPMQWGNFASRRAAWCPGRNVDPWRVDLTADLKAGSNQLGYQMQVDGANYISTAADPGSIDMWGYVILYGAAH
jgi:hypothetical protein